MRIGNRFEESCSVRVADSRRVESPRKTDAENPLQLAAAKGFRRAVGDREPGDHRSPGKGRSIERTNAARGVRRWVHGSFSRMGPGGPARPVESRAAPSEPSFQAIAPRAAAILCGVADSASESEQATRESNRWQNQESHSPARPRNEGRIAPPAQVCELAPPRVTAAANPASSAWACDAKKTKFSNLIRWISGEVGWWKCRVLEQPTTATGRSESQKAHRSRSGSRRRAGTRSRGSAARRGSHNL